MEYFFLRFEKRIAISEKKAPLELFGKDITLVCFIGELLRKILETSNQIYALEECGTEQKSRALLFSRFELFICGTVFYHTHHVKG